MSHHDWEDFLWGMFWGWVSIAVVLFIFFLGVATGVR